MSIAQEIEVPTVEQCVREDALEVQDIRELGLGWAWFVNDGARFAFSRRACHPD